MAETLTYENTQEATSAENLNADEQDSLQVGEAMQDAQDNLLAGKYKSAEDLEAAYLELQKKLGKSEGTQPTLEAEDESTPAPQMYSDDGSVNYDTANEFYGEQLGNLFKENSIDPFAMNQYFAENNGTLSDDMYSQLSKAGLTKDIVDNYLKGVRDEVGIEPAQPVLNEAEITEIKNLANGEAGYDALMEWAGQNLDPTAQQEYDAVLATANKSAIKFAVTALMGKYEDSQGRDSNIVTGKESATETYRSMAEVVRDMNKPEYQNDEAFRDDVIRKLSASNLKV